jgi:hypothetical protein
MNPFLKQFVFTASLAAAVLGATIVSAAEGKYAGTPRDIDYIKNNGWTQVILAGKPPNESLVAHAKNDRLISILLVGLSLKSEAAGHYVEDSQMQKSLTSVSLEIKGKEEQGYVHALSFDEKEGYYRAKVFSDSKPVKVWTKSAAMQGILETAVRLSIPVEEFAFDPKTFEITRGKVNIKLGK